MSFSSNIGERGRCTLGFRLPVNKEIVSLQIKLSFPQLKGFLVFPIWTYTSKIKKVNFYFLNNCQVKIIPTNNYLALFLKSTENLKSKFTHYISN